MKFQSGYHWLKTKPPYLLKAVAKTREVIADSLTKMLMDGPEVSFNGSPTVSPVTAALWASLCFLNTYFPSTSSPKSVLLDSFVPASMYFLALSQAPPVLLKEKAI